MILNEVLSSCCLLGHGETVIQRRMDGLINFDQTWETYENGFGALQGERTLSFSLRFTENVQSHYYRVSTLIVSVRMHVDCVPALPHALWQGSSGWASGTSVPYWPRATLSSTSSWKTGNRAGTPANTPSTSTVPRRTTPLISGFCPGTCQTPWATLPTWRSPPRTGIVTNSGTPTVPTVTQVQQIYTCSPCLFNLRQRSRRNENMFPNCFLSGGWWFSACGDAFLNGKYFHLRPKGRTERRKGIQWRSGPKAFTSLKSTQISIRQMAPPSSVSSTSSQMEVFH